MTRPRERRLDAGPDPLAGEEEVEDEAVIEAKYRLLHRRLKRYAARMEARDPGYFDRIRRERGDAPQDV